jgi:hypothetical protein
VALLLVALYSPDLTISLSWRRALRALPLFAAGYALALLPFAIYFLAHGTLSDVGYCLMGIHADLRAFATSDNAVGSLGAKLQLLGDTFGNGYLWPMAGTGILYACLRRERRALVPGLWLAGYAAFLFVAYYKAYPHYLLTWTAPLAMLAGYGTVALFGSLWEATARPAAGKVIPEVCLLVAGASAWEAEILLDAHRTPMASPCIILCAVALLFLVRPSGSRPGVMRFARACLVGFAALGALLLYVSRREEYRIPRLTCAQEREISAWVCAQRTPGDDVANLASSVFTLYGQWRDLPIVWKGRVMFQPMWMGGATTPYFPETPLYRDTLALWEKTCRVRFVMVLGEYQDNLVLSKNRVLRDYIETNFRRVKSFSWPGEDPHDAIHIFERVTPFQTGP